MDPKVVERVQEIKDRFEESRAGLMTQLFITLATANGGGLAALLAMIGQKQTPSAASKYVAIIATLLGLGLLSVLVSSFFRFYHSKRAEKEKIAKLESDAEEEKRQSAIRVLLQIVFTGLMWSSLACLLLAISVGVIGVVHN